MSQWQKKASSGLYGARDDNEEADTPTIRVTTTPSRPSSNPPPSLPIFMRDALPAATFPFILAWDRLRNMLDCTPPWLGLFTPSSNEQLNQRMP